MRRVRLRSLIYATTAVSGLRLLEPAFRVLSKSSFLVNGRLSINATNAKYDILHCVGFECP